MASSDEPGDAFQKTVCLTNQTKLTKEGFSSRFVDDIDKLDIECAFCCMVMREAKQISTCGHSFCGSCLGDWIRTHEENGTPVHCPIDDKLVDVSRVFEDRKQDRFIGGLKVYCDHVEAGCGETPELRYLQDHLKDCQYQTVTCDMDCGEVMLLGSLSDHVHNHCPLRIVECGMCGECIQASHSASHEETCPLKLITCQYCLTDAIPRNQLRRHESKDCPKFPTFCSFALFGCKDKMARDTLEDHHETAIRDHLHLMTSAVYQLFTTSDTVPELSHIPFWPHELPANLWGRVGDGGESSHETNIPWTELPGCEVQAERYSVVTLGKKVVQLEEWKVNAQMRMDQADAKINTLTAEVVTAKETITTLTAEKGNAFDIKMLADENKRLSDTIMTNENNMKQSMDDMARKFEEKMEKFEENMKNNMTARMGVVETRTAELNKVVNDANSQIAKSNGDISFMKSLVDYGEVKDLVEGVHNVCPCSWRVKLVTNTERISSPEFFTSDGYLMIFCVRWMNNQFTVGALLRKGQNDDNLEWPWNGRESVTVTNTATGERVGVCKNENINRLCRIRSYDDILGNGKFLLYIICKVDMENMVLTLTMKKT